MFQSPRSVKLWHDPEKKIIDNVQKIGEKIEANGKNIIDEFQKIQEIGNIVKKSEKNIIYEFQELPKAFSADMIRQLFDYPSMTSSGLAEMFAIFTSEWYERNYKRVLVDYAQDTYILKGLDKVIEADEMDVWVLEFKQEWKWINDSDEIKKPFKDLSIILTTTDEAISLSDAFLDDKKPKGLYFNQRKDFFNLTKKENIVRLQIVHKETSKPLHPDAVNKMFEISEIEVTTKDEDGKKLTFGKEIKEINKGEDINGNKWPCGVYKAYKIEGEIENQSLEQDDWMIVILKGRILLPVWEEVLEESGNVSKKFGVSNEAIKPEILKYGVLTFRFSDIIRDHYTLSFIYPKRMLGIKKGLHIVQYESLKAYEPLIQDVKEPKVGGEHHSTVKGPITDLHYIKLIWEELGKREE